MHRTWPGPAVALALVVGAGTAAAEGIAFHDPVGDDFGPGRYVYPSDSALPPGAFDLTGVALTREGGTLKASITLAAPLDGARPAGFSQQMVFVFVDNAPGGHTEGLPGLNVRFSPDSPWDKVLVLSPQTPERLDKEIRAKAAALAADIVLPGRMNGSGDTITASFDAARIGGNGRLADWGYQVVTQANEGFPAGGDLLTRRVDESPRKSRFGGGDDGDCDPNVLDVLAGGGRGEAGEVAAQKAMLAYECELDGSPRTLATLRMVRPPPPVRLDDLLIGNRARRAP